MNALLILDIYFLPPPPFFEKMIHETLKLRLRFWEEIYAKKKLNFEENTHSFEKLNGQIPSLNTSKN